MTTTDSGSYCYDYPRPAVTVDVAAVCRAVDGWQVLLIRRRHDPFRGRWALPGGFVDIDEDLVDAARRELQEETGLAAGDLRQLVTVGTPGRDPRGRTISVVYLMVCERTEALVAGDDADRAEWFDLDAPPPLAFDHAELLATIASHLPSSGATGE